MRQLEIPEIRVEKFELGNGLTLLVSEQHYAEVASVQAWCQTGSIHEQEWLGGGLTHLLEHMLFKGTARRTATDISEEIHRGGGYVNAYTSFDRTVFWIDCPKAVVGTALDVLADMLFASSIDAGELEREMDVIRREFEMGYDDPDRVLSHLTFGTAYQLHPCRTPVIGLRRVFDRITRDDVLRYYRRRYVPDNVFIVVAGDVDAETVRRQVETCFGQVVPAPVAPIVVPEEPPQLGCRRESRIFDSQVGYFSLAWHVPAVTHEDMPGLDILSVLLGGGASSLLYDELREKRGLVHGIGAYAFTPSFPGLLTISGTCPVENVAVIESETQQKLVEWRKRPLTDEQLAKAKRIIQVSAWEQLQTVKGVASDIGLNWLYTRNLHFDQRYLQRVQSVSSDQVHRVFDRYLYDDNLTVATLRPKSSIVSRRPRFVAEKQPEMRVLPNGVRVVFIPDHRLPMLHASMVFRGGVLAEHPHNNGIHRLYSHSLVKGTKHLSGAEVAEQVESLGGTLFGDSGYNSSRIAFSSLAADFGKVLALVEEILSSASFPDDAIERERAGQIAAIESEDAQPGILGRNVLRAAAYGDHPYAMNVIGTRRSVASISREDLVRLHEQIVDSAPCALAVCGWIDGDELWPAIAKFLSILPKRSPVARFKVPKIGPLSSQTLVQHHQKHQAFISIGYLACSLFDRERIPFELLDEATGDASSRFFVKLREELGLAYSVGSSLSLGLAPGLFSIYAATSPEFAEEVVQLCRNEMEDLGQGALSKDELERSKTKLLAQLAFQKQNLEAYAHGLALNEIYGFGLEYLERRQREIETTTLENVQTVCRKYLMDKPAITVIVRP
jgi:zinc protease